MEGESWDFNGTKEGGGSDYYVKKKPSKNSRGPYRKEKRIKK